MDTMEMSLGERMKRYEGASETHLKNKMPVVIRLDGRAFHTFTRNFHKPFDEIFSETMCETMLYLCRNIAHCILGYTQSDEITLVLADYETDVSKPWLDNRLQKLCSISASMATAVFNRIFEAKVNSRLNRLTQYKSGYISQKTGEIELATFDSRCFNLPDYEVVNCLIWRQSDAIRNSVAAMAQSIFSRSELHKKGVTEMREMIREKTGVAWESIPIGYQRGFCAVRKVVPVQTQNGVIDRKKWVLDDNIPLFDKERSYITGLMPGLPVGIE